MWDDAEPTLLARAGGAFVCMIGAKLLSIQVPFFFKQAVDVLTDPAATVAGGGGGETALAVALTPAALMALYGTFRASSEVLTQLRNALFVQVTEGGLRRMARRTFRHLHTMELRFHLNRQTGALSRVVERGTRAVGTLLSMAVLQVLPLAFEATVVTGLLARHGGLTFATITLSTLATYATFTFVMVRWRTHIRKAQNAADTQASQRFTESLINYETIKYFDATDHEERRYDQALER